MLHEKRERGAKTSQEDDWSVVSQTEGIIEGRACCYATPGGTDRCARLKCRHMEVLTQVAILTSLSAPHFVPVKM